MRVLAALRADKPINEGISEDQFAKFKEEHKMAQTQAGSKAWVRKKRLQNLTQRIAEQAESESPKRIANKEYYAQKKTQRSHTRHETDHEQ